MTFKFIALTDTGRSRDNNEDALVFDEETGVAVLADGMGGYNAGEVASSMATTLIRDGICAWLRGAGALDDGAAVRQAMEDYVQDANLAIFQAANANPQYSGMGTTLVMAVFRDSMVHVGHVGDSRCYRLRGGVLQQITRDHSLLQEQLDAGLVTPEQALHSNIRNLVTRAVGVEAMTLLEVNSFLIEPGDLYLLCSDGLSDMVQEAAIAKIVSADVDIRKKAEILVDTANQNGGRDNISVLMVEAGESADKRGLIARLLGK